MWKTAAIRSASSLLRAKSSAPRAMIVSLQVQSCSHQKKHLSTAPERNDFQLDVSFASDLVRPHDEFVHTKDEKKSNVAVEMTSFESLRDTPRTSVLMELTDRVGVLHDVLKFFWKYDVNITRIESRPHKMDAASGEEIFDFFLDLYVCVKRNEKRNDRIIETNDSVLGCFSDGQRGDENVEKLLEALKPLTNKLLVLDDKHVQVAYFITRVFTLYCCILTFPFPLVAVVSSSYFGTGLDCQSHPRCRCGLGK